MDLYFETMIDLLVQGDDQMKELTSLMNIYSTSLCTSLMNIYSTYHFDSRCITMVVSYCSGCCQTPRMALALTTCPCYVLQFQEGI